MSNDKEVREILTDFIKQYEIDMRGDKDVSNGNKGVIGEIRDIKRYHRECPSLIFLLKTKPIQTIGAILLVFVSIMVLYDLGVLPLLLTYFGVPIP